MIVANVYVRRASFGPAEDHSPLVVDADAVVSGEATLEGFEPVSGWRNQVSQHVCVVKHIEFSGDDPTYARPSNTFRWSTGDEEALHPRAGKLQNRHVDDLYLGQV